ncbi:hypothetical protein ACFL3H_00735 [Gemmatimonadota bacterium]
MVMTKTHEPTSEFIARLEWQVRSTLSRRDRFSMPTRRPVQQVMKMAALLLLSIFLGAAGVATADQVQESRARELLLQRIDFEMQLAGAQLQLLRTRVSEIRDQVEGGLAHEAVLRTATFEMRGAELHYTRLQLDREEISLSGREPQQNVSAPRIGGRDFVSERLELEIARTSDECELVEAGLTRTRELIEQGMLNRSESLEQEAALSSLKLHLRYLTSLHDLRAQFLEGKISRDKVEQEALLAEAESRLDHTSLAAAQVELRRVEELYQKGAVTESELMQARIKVITAEFKLQQVLVRIEQLASAASEPPPM